MSHKDLPILLIATCDGAKVAFFKKALKDIYNLLFAGNAESTIDHLKSIKVDCVLLDGGSPSLHPLVLSKQIRSLKSYRLIPVMLITPTIKKAYMQTAFEAGITDFIHTPLEKTELLERLAVAFARVKEQTKTSAFSSFIAKNSKPNKTSKISLALRMKKLTKGDFFTELAATHDIPPPICLLMIEVDGHAAMVKEKGAKEASDRVQEIGTFLLQHMRAKDLLFPQGDHNFLAILPKTSLSAGRTLAEMIREDVAEQCAGTISIGMEYYETEMTKISAPASAFHHLVEGAMRALQTARKTGNKTISTEEFKRYEISV